jgi:hypothetical protein
VDNRNQTPGPNVTRASVADRIRSTAELVTNVRTLVLAFGGLVVAAFFVYLAWNRGLFQASPSTPLPLTVSDFQVSKVTEIASASLDKSGHFDSYAFDATGNRFDYRREPSRSGYIIQYSIKVQGVGKCEIDFWVQDDKTKLILTPTTNVEADAVVQSEGINHEFFIQNPNVDRAVLFVTVNVDPNGSVQSQAVPLAFVQRPWEAVAVNDAR